MAQYFVDFGDAPDLDVEVKDLSWLQNSSLVSFGVEGEPAPFDQIAHSEAVRRWGVLGVIEGNA